MTKKTPVFEISPVPTDGTCKDETKKKNSLNTCTYKRNINTTHIVYSRLYRFLDLFEILFLAIGQEMDERKYSIKTKAFLFRILRKMFKNYC